MGVQKVNFTRLKKLNKNGITLKNKSLKELTTFRIGGIAKFYLEIPTIENFIKVILYLENRGEYLVLGNGSNILVSDQGYPGVVIRLNDSFDKILIKDDEMEVGAGVLIARAVGMAKKNDLSGLEFAIGIPCTIGGAVYMNAGAYSSEMSNIVSYVIAYHQGKIKYFSHDDCEFNYRESIFQRDNYIILRVGLKLHLDTQSNIQDRMQEIIKSRKNSQPLDKHSAGSVFKRIGGYNVSKMLDDLGVKGLRCGGAMVSEKHANFIVNDDNASADDVYTLICQIKRMFLDRYHLDLHTEIKFIGEMNEING